MNQSILFPDLQTWDEQNRTMTFPAQQSGALIECIVSQEELEKASGQSISDAQQAQDLFAQYRFELEELAEQLIEDEEFNADGKVEVIS